jgi:hypothetical protein
MPFANRRIAPTLCATLLFLAGIAVGSVLTRHVSAVNKFGQPKTVVHVVAYKFRDATSLNDQELPESRTWPRKFRVSRISG